ncbi:MAG: bifunctional isocitrate dehydrogenase kinase/phosphatase [Deltaproteobacteria bacterium]|nr:bifunctional isocitrate dehydrogenase kinase/phosphatase [Deltaproteobacteria bacterium]
MTKRAFHKRLTHICAKTIIKAFHEYQDKFKMITQRAKTRFENRDWHGLKADSDERLDLYKNVVDQIVFEIRRLLNNRINDKEIWMSIKTIYFGLSSKLEVWELAETFFNSVTRKIFSTIGVDPQIEFVDTCTRIQPILDYKPPYRIFTGTLSTQSMIETILSDFEHKTAYENIRRDSKLASEIIEDHLKRSGYSPFIERAEILTSVHYRGKGAYLVGRIFNGTEFFPLVLALLNTPEGIAVDAVMLNENEASVLFSFTRSYFHVHVDRPNEWVSFLKSIMPRKRIAELYISIGYNKHGKSELYCDLLHHLNRSNKKFELAEGERGMVMEVFTIPDYDLVFKVIKDHFAYPKITTRDAVMAKYDLVFKHDRAGRLVDAQEFEHLKFNRSRFSDGLLESLKRNTAHNVIINDDNVIVKHVYVERRVIPLNIYLSEVDEAEALTAVVDYGNAIKDLAVSNIFPGDLLLKNFGVTRHGRIVFYDYDELCLLSICNFRVMPQPRSYDEELSAEPWFGVGENDFFPEEFRNFIGLQGKLREVFLEHHEDLFNVRFWHQVQSRIDSGETIDIFPYGQSNRLARIKTG